MPENKVIDLKQLGKYAESCAQKSDTSGYVRGRTEADRIRKAMSVILSWKPGKYMGEQGVSTAAEWIMDNRYLIEREAIDAAAHFKRIKRLVGAKDRPAICEAADRLLSVSAGAVDSGRLEVFLDAFNEVLMLPAEDLSAFIPAIKAAAVRQIADICCGLNSGKGENAASLLSGLIGTLRNISQAHCWLAVERTDRVERILSADPSGHYLKMDDDTRRAYRRQVSRIAKQRGISEQAAARYAVDEAVREDEHVGAVLFPRSKAARTGRRRGGAYICSVVLLTFAAALTIGFCLSSPWAAILLLIPVSEVVKNLVDIFTMRILKAKPLPRLELSGGIPNKGRTLCAVSVLLADEKDGAKYAKLLEEYAIANANAGENLLFALLADLPESDSQEAEKDAEILRAAASAVDELNKQRGGGFALFCRPRTWSNSNRKWMGRERKRGAIEDLMFLLRGGETQLRLSGDSAAIKNIKYVLALDADTRLVPGAALRLTAAAMHPLNKAVIDRERKTVVSGYGVFQPRISVGLSAANKTWFTRLFAGKGGCDPYSGVCSDLYQDLTGNGSFNGKGLIDVDAYYICLKDRFPSERVLSHDLLEGAFLSCGYVSDVELTDGFPSNAASWYTRQERWVRGDWQAAHWLRMRVLDGCNKRVANCLGDADKWKLLDNLRRSLVPLFSLLAIVAGIAGGVDDFLITAAVAAASYLSDAILSFAGQLTHKAASRVRLRPESGRFIWDSLGMMLLKLAFLPYEAWVNTSAAVVALYRVAVSKRNLLLWVTADQAERNRANTLSSYYISMWPCIISAAFAMVLADGAAIGLAAVLWLLAPAVARLLASRLSSACDISAADKAFLKEMCQKAYAYFSDTGAEDNHLPPDNRQERPAVGTAHRTSPTNIGMALLSHLAACDMGLAAPEQALERIGNTIATLESMKKWKGHLYNWYDTRSLKVIGGAYVSTVDSGNLAACMLALSTGLNELGASQLAARAEKLAYQADFAALYDKHRGLFYTGWDTLADKPSNSMYDLLASEARLTSYTAVALGQIPLRHWKSLGRLHLAGKSSSGLASWTGTMFEYFMPDLLLRSDRGSMLWESLRFCLKEQMHAHEPWGESESSFFEFDNSLSYCYKAHGVQSLALKRGMSRDKVISPYSSFLVLEYAGGAAVKNLRRLAKDGLCGRYGFFEAADYTPRRQDGSLFRPVCTFMAHHIGMSIIAADNAINSGVMASRFMRRKEMAAFKPLLEEKAADNAPILTRRPCEEPERERYARRPSWEVKAAGTDPFCPRTALLSNGAYSLLLTDTGVSRSKLADIELTRFKPDLDDGYGMAVLVRKNGGLLPVTQAPWFNKETHYAFAADLSECTVAAQKGDLAAKMTASVPELETGEVRRFSILSHEGGKCELILLLRPVLMPAKDYEAHPAFARLMLDYESIDNGVLIHRRPGGRKPAKWMCIKWDRSAVFSVSWEDTLGRGNVPCDPVAQSPVSGPMPDGSLVISIQLDLRANVHVDTAISMSVADMRDDAVLAAERILLDKAGECGKSAAHAAMRYGLDETGIDSAMELLAQLEFSTPENADKKELLLRQSGRAEDLWPLGISGDLPVAAYAAKDDPAVRLRQPVAVHRFLTALGESYDLVLLTRDSGDYMRAENAAIQTLLQKMDASHTVGMRGGIHVVDTQEPAAVAAVSASVPHKSRRVLSRTRGTGEMRQNLPRSYPRFVRNSQGEYECVFSGVLPPRAYSHVLANSVFGYIAAESGTGHMWHKNAREGKITPWLNDRYVPEGPEKIGIRTGGRLVSLFAADDGYSCRVRYGFGYAVWEKEIEGVTTSLTIYTALDKPIRLARVSIRGSSEPLELEYFAKLASGADNEGVIDTKAQLEDNVFTFSAPVGGSGSISIALGTAPSAFTCDCSKYLQNDFDGSTGPGCVPCCAARLSVSADMVIAVGCCDKAELTAYCQPLRADEELAAVKEEWLRRVQQPIVVDTPDDELNGYLNGWALYQATACRMLARAGIDQCGGAYGFRDQLQDCRALVWTEPEKAREHIILAASRQYLEGDVQHWWHPGPDGGKGVRTRYSDDLVWLPLVLAEYVEKTGDLELCHHPVPWLTSLPLSDTEKERYEHAGETPEKAPLTDHALKALELVHNRGTGPNSLLLMGSGDWNDGMDLTDDGKQAESVWLSEFVSLTAQKMAGLCRRLHMDSDADRLDGWSRDLNSAVASLWQDGCYPRAFRPDGSVLGRADSPECAVDSISQSFACFAGVDREKTDAAVMTAYSALCHDGVARLFAPPFNGGVDDPGYILRYCPGFRENGGQYTHAAIWLASALLRTGRRDEGGGLLLSLLPAKKQPEIYRGEPYVVAGDVCSSLYMPGRVGWTWYTGSAAWYFTTAVEDLLGLKLKDGCLHVSPSLPSGWQGYRAQIHGREIEVSVQGGSYRVLCDGKPLKGGADIFSDPGQKM